jgi:hypothetical protein
VNSTGKFNSIVVKTLKLIFNFSPRGTLCTGLCEAGVVMSSYKSTQLEWGTVGEREGRMGREREGGGQFTSNLGPEWTGIAPHTKEGFQVSERDMGTKEGSPGKWGNYQGENVKGFVPCALIFSTLYIHIMLSCVSVANKRIVFRL